MNDGKKSLQRIPAKLLTYAVDSGWIYRECRIFVSLELPDNGTPCVCGHDIHIIWYPTMCRINGGTVFHLTKGRINLRSSTFALALGFGILLVVIGMIAVFAIRRAGNIFEEMNAAQDAYLRAEQFRGETAADTYVASILIRDYLLDPSVKSALERRQELLAMKESIQKREALISSNVPEEERARLDRLRSEAEAYWDSLEPVFDWTPQEKAAKGLDFLARNWLPRRESVVKLAREDAEMNISNLEKERQRLNASQMALGRFLLEVTGLALVLGTCVALLTIRRVTTLEKRHDAQRGQIEDSQNNLRRLSQRLVETQESERQALSRELHDEVGQTLTALGIGLGNMEKLRGSDPAAFQAVMEDAKRLNADAMRAIRDLAMGLRPSMLDDLGLEAALDWQGREFSRRTGVQATVHVNAELDSLADAQKTCIYRVVQEALTNCARHAHAGRVDVSVSLESDRIHVVIRDDGQGFNSILPIRGGLGLLGIQERVQALQGSVNIKSELKKGTVIAVHIPAGVEA
jgi:signal transduction histidine kinase